MRLARPLVETSLPKIASEKLAKKLVAISPNNQRHDKGNLFL